MALPSISDFVDAAVTEAGFKTAITNLRNHLAGLLGVDGTQAAALAALGAIFSAGILTKTEAYTVAAADRGKTVDCSGTWTLSLPSAAAIGAGFAFSVRNSGAGVISIQPSASEQINTAATYQLAGDTSVVCVSTGSGWITIGGGGSWVPSNVGAYNIGSFVSAVHTTSLAYKAKMSANTIVAGSSLRPVAYVASEAPSSPTILGLYDSTTGASLPGTWKLMQDVYNPVNAAKYPLGLWQRIA